MLKGKMSISEKKGRAKRWNKIAVIMAIMAFLFIPIFFDVRVGNLSGWFTVLFLIMGALSFRIPYPYERSSMNKVGLLITGLYGVFLAISFAIHFVQLDTVIIRSLAGQIDHSVEVRVSLRESSTYYDEYSATVYVYMDEDAFLESELPNQVEDIIQTVSSVLNEYNNDLWLLNIRFVSRNRTGSWISSNIISNSFTTCSYRFVCSHRYPEFTVSGNILRYFSDYLDWGNTIQWTPEELEWLVAENSRLTSIIDEVRQETVYIDDRRRNSFSPHLDRQNRTSNFLIPFNEAVNHENFEAVSQDILRLMEDANRNGADIQSITVTATGVFDFVDTNYRLIYRLDVESGMSQLDVDVNPGGGWLLFEDVSFGEIEETILSVDDALEALHHRLMGMFEGSDVLIDTISIHHEPHQFGDLTRPRTSIEVHVPSIVGVEGFGDFVVDAQPEVVEKRRLFTFGTQGYGGGPAWELFFIYDERLVWRVWFPSGFQTATDRGDLITVDTDATCPTDKQCIWHDEFLEVRDLRTEINEVLSEWDVE